MVSASMVAYGATTKSSSSPGSMLEWEPRTRGIDKSDEYPARYTPIRKRPRDIFVVAVLDLQPDCFAASMVQQGIGEGRVNKSGIKYSNIVPLQEGDLSAAADISGRLSENQCSIGTSPLAIATRLARRHSLASKS